MVSTSSLKQLLDHPPGLARSGARDLEELAERLPAPVKVIQSSKSAGVMKELTPPPSTVPASLRTLGKLFPTWRPAAETVLGRAGYVISRPLLRDLARVVHSTLGERHLSDLSDLERAALQDHLRAHLLTTSQTVDQEFLNTANDRARRLLKRPNASTDLLTVPVEGGLWIYIVPSRRRDVVVAEAFAPAKSGTAVPVRPPLPGVAAPKWALDDGYLVPTPPSVANRHLGSGLPPGALQEAPGILLDTLTRAERRRHGLSESSITGASVAYKGVPEEMQGALGGGVREVRYQVTENGWRRVTIEGRTLEPARRIGDEKKALETVKALFGESSGIERLHLWGSVLGDSVTAGIAYGPKELNQAMGILEDILKTKKGLAGMKSADVTVSAIIEMREVAGAQYPFLLRATYQWTDEGVTYTFSVGIDDFTGQVYLRSGLGEGEDVLQRVKSLRKAPKGLKRAGSMRQRR